VGLLFGYYSNESSGGGSGKYLCSVRLGMVVLALLILRIGFICLCGFSCCVEFISVARGIQVVRSFCILQYLIRCRCRSLPYTTGLV